MNDLNDIQKIEYELLKFFTDLCERNNLKYYVSGGTCLGAVRHSGFIPWDDDVDIDMPRRDYDKLIKLFSDRKVNCSRYEVENIFLENGEDLITKLVDKSHKIKISYAKEEQSVRPWIDIMPIDGMPDSKIRFEIHWLHIILKVV
ncbi:MAG: LicD family protein [Lachnospiraceae bacterium]|nr:LicD family protein [Lachnospiraceae bacterium]